MKKIHFFLLIFIIILGIGIILDFNDPDFNYHDIIVEFHGLMFDLLVLGLILGLYENYNDKRNKIDKYQEEIDDFRRWESEEAKFKTIGNIKRLYNLGIKKFNLSHCYLKDGDLQEYDFTDSNFAFADLRNVIFSRSNLTKCSFPVTNLQEALFVETIVHKTHLDHSDLSSSTLTNCDFSYSSLRNVNLKNAKICATDFNEADLSFADLENVKVYDMNWLQNLELNGVKGMEKLKERYYIDPSIFEHDEIGEYWIVLKKPAHINV